MGGHADAGHRDWADGVSKGEGGEGKRGGGEALHIERNEWKGYGSWFGSTHFQGWGWSGDTELLAPLKEPQ